MNPMDHAPSWSQSTEAERYVLACALLNGEIAADVCEKLTGDDFTTSTSKTIFETIAQLNSAGRIVDFVTVSDALNGNSMYSPNDWLDILVDLSRSVPATANYTAYVAIVQAKSRRRQLNKIGKALMRGAQDEGREPDDIAGAAIAECLRMTSAGDTTNVRSSEEVLIAAWEYLELLATPGFTSKSGIAGLDALMGGLRKGELTIIAARPAVGKSALAWQIAENFARRGQRTLFISLEMSNEQLGQRMMAREGADIKRGLAGKFGEDDWAKVGDIMQRKSRLPILSGQRLYSPQEIEKAAKEFKSAGGLALLIIDYLQLMHPAGRFNNREQEVSSLSRAVKRMALDLDIPVLCLSQLNRAVETRAVKMPQLSDLRDSGAIEQDADNVLFLHRPIKPEDVSAADREELQEILKTGSQLIIANLAKHRNGPVGSFKLIFEPPRVRFTDLAEGFHMINDPHNPFAREG